MIVFPAGALKAATAEANIGEQVRMVGDSMGFRLAAADLEKGIISAVLKHVPCDLIECEVNRELLAKIAAALKGDVELTATESVVTLKAGKSKFTLSVLQPIPRPSYTLADSGETLMLAHDEWKWICDNLGAAIKARKDNPYKDVTVFPSKESVDIVATSGTYMCGVHLDGVRSLSAKHDLPLGLFKASLMDVTLTFAEDTVTASDDFTSITMPYGAAGVPDMYWQLLEPTEYARLKFSAVNGERLYDLTAPIRGTAKVSFRWYGSDAGGFTPCVHVTTLDESDLDLAGDVALDGQFVVSGVVEGNAPVYTNGFRRALKAMDGAEFSIIISPSAQVVFRSLHRFALFMRATVKEPV